MVLIWVSSVAGAAVIAVLSIGWVSWMSFVLSGLVGLIIGVPAGIWNARTVKRDDPNWPPKRSRHREARQS
ncbi:MAG: hypothetical protein FH759_12925 [Sediminimonas qiaohouensis]|uniref:Uncharacterized protein n=2 Tax=Roseobacteraceae TaxID=2854170 RepID=A0A7C9HPI1_9RHOB|nr:hypothetical protein [Sediminimonas qiaohouensis]